VAIDFTLSDSQQELQKNAKAFAEGVLRPVAGQIDRAADGWESFLAGREAYREMAHAGFTKAYIPAAYGGAGFSMLDLAIAAEELTCVDVNVPTTLLGTGLGLQPVIQFGSAEQKERFLRPFADDPEGDLLASYAFTDVAGGANFDSPDPVGGMQTIARRDGDEWVRAAFEYALDFARSEKRLGTVPVIEHQNTGFMLADIKMRIEACRYLTWKACHDFERSGGRAEELAIMTKVYCSEAAVDTIYDCMRVVGIASYTRDLAPLEKIMRDAMVFPLYDGGNQGVRRRQLHDIMRHPGYDSMLAARGEGLPGDG